MAAWSYLVAVTAKTPQRLSPQVWGRREDSISSIQAGNTYDKSGTGLEISFLVTPVEYLTLEKRFFTSPATTIRTPLSRKSPNMAQKVF